MKKQVSLALAAAFALSVAGTALAAPTNPFTDVKPSDWAYDAVVKLANDGIINGYGDGTFLGQRNITRYEMAAIIAKIVPGKATGEDANLVKRLHSEYAQELYNLGVRVDKLEQNASTIKFSGDARIRYQQNGAYIATKNESGNSRFQERLRINMNAQINDNMQFIGRIRWDTTSNYRSGGAPQDKDSAAYLDRAEFKYNAGKATVEAGRIFPKFGEGLLWWDERADGVLVGFHGDKFKAQIGYLDLNSDENLNNVSSYTTNWTPTVNAGVIDLGLAVSKNINLTGTYLKSARISNAGPGTYAAAPWIVNSDNFKFNNWAVGGDATFGDFKLLGEYTRNTDGTNQVKMGDKKAAWGRLQWKNADIKKPGSYQLYVEYLRFGGQSIPAMLGGQATLNQLDLPAYSAVNNGNGYWDGIKGWGGSFKYAIAKNTTWEIGYWDLKPENGSRNGLDLRHSLESSLYFFF